MRLINSLTGIAALGAGALFITAPSFAATTLNVGDISILGYRSDADDGLAFVTWVDLDAGTEIKFTDCGYNGNGTWRASENFLSWSNNTFGTIAAGTVITLSFPDSPGTPSSDLGGVISGNLNGTSSSGDQLFAYQYSGAGTGFSGTSTSETFAGNMIFGLTTNAWLTSGSTNSNTSYLPTELASSIGNLNFATEVDNGQYTGIRSGLSNLLDYRALVLNTSNWTREDAGTTVLDSTDFTTAPAPGALALLGVAGLVSRSRRRSA
ncbi:MAG TPA: hypothetical protein VG711_03525 [Phycisphaerales bacterium]|nr:hypothetical protein [Phycisphaerales bacterium]